MVHAFAFFIETVKNKICYFHTSLCILMIIVRAVQKTELYSKTHTFACKQLSIISLLKLNTVIVLFAI